MLACKIAICNYIRSTSHNGKYIKEKLLQTYLTFVAKQYFRTLDNVKLTNNIYFTAAGNAVSCMELQIHSSDNYT